MGPAMGLMGSWLPGEQMVKRSDRQAGRTREGSGSRRWKGVVAAYMPNSGTNAAIARR
jgi:hypothetical protein